MAGSRGFVGGSSGSGDWGLLLIRLGIGLSMLFFHGYGKITAGPAAWTKTGAAMGHLGIAFIPVFWGLMAALAESAGSALLVLGVLFRPAAAMLCFNMLVAIFFHLNMQTGSPASGWAGASHALELFTVYLGLLLTGPGKFSLAPRWGK
jgi:putative oxidoreductase